MSAAHHGDDEDEGHLLAHEEHEGGHDEPWLVSYADMMTLLFGFFVVLYSFAAAKLDKLPAELDSMVMMRKEVAQHFGGSFLTPMSEAAAALENAARSASPEGEFKVEVTPEGLEATFTSQSLFASGSAELAEWARTALESLGKSLLERVKEYQIVVEGHTDDAPTAAVRHLYPSNWELSGARASSVVRVFEGVGLQPQALTAVGYGASRPVAPNRSAEGAPVPDNMARNRRIHLKVAVLDQKGTPPGTVLERIFGPREGETKP